MAGYLAAFIVGAGVAAVGMGLFLGWLFRRVTRGVVLSLLVVLGLAMASVGGGMIGLLIWGARRGQFGVAVLWCLGIVLASRIGLTMRVRRGEKEVAL